MNSKKLNSVLEEPSHELDEFTDNTWRQKSYRDREFIQSDAARPIRVLCELTAPGERFKEEQLSKYYEEGVELAKKLAEWSEEIVQPEKRFYICSGGGPGMMEAANKGAELGGARSVGLNINLPFEQTPNPYQTEQISFEFHYFFIRKFWFANLAKALVVFPGGFGTMDELFEVLTLIQTKKITKKMPIVLYGNEFWEGFMNPEHLLKWGVISPEDLELFKICDSPEEAFEYLKHELTETYL